MIALAIAGFAIFRYFGSSQVNPVTGETQRISIRPDQEIALGLQAAPELAQQFGGESRDPRGRQLVDEVGREIVSSSDAKKSPYRFEFHLLDDERTYVNDAEASNAVFIKSSQLSRRTIL